ncbi:MAG: exodeoxyribonuclease III [Halieaceae bacterium]|jgi:exodeoxyribonuclease-3|nr:exodeoxyribonuclease III [Halieaceae bacterium]
MRVVSLVVEGLERAQQEGLLDWLWQQDADVICLQDTRCSEYSLRDDAFFPSDYNAYFLDDFDDHRRNGVAIYCRKLPKAIMTGLGFADFDSRGIYIQADYQELSVGSLLMPSGLAGDVAQATKLQFMEQLGAHLQKVRNKRRDFILCGGWELVHQPIDAEEAGNQVAIPGFSKEERVWLNTLYESGYCDAFREVNQDADEYSWWPEGDDAGGLRSDTHIISDSLSSRVERAVIYTADAFSSHAPVIIDYDTDP